MAPTSADLSEGLVVHSQHHKSVCAVVRRDSFLRSLPEVAFGKFPCGFARQSNSLSESATCALPLHWIKLIRSCALQRDVQNCRTFRYTTNRSAPLEELPRVLPRIQFQALNR